MALLYWKQQYSVGIKAVDEEHRKLIELINRLHDSIQSDDSAKTVLGFFGDLFELISSHFALEEVFMRNGGYDELNAHKEDHEQLLDEIRDIMDAFEYAEALDSKTLALRLDAWFSIHFRTHDERLHRALGSPRE